MQTQNWNWKPFTLSDYQDYQNIAEYYQNDTVEL